MKCKLPEGLEDYLFHFRIEPVVVLALQVRLEPLVVNQNTGGLFEITDKFVDDLLGQDRGFGQNPVEGVSDQSACCLAVELMQLKVRIDHRVSGEMALTLQMQQVFSLGDVKKLCLFGDRLDELLELEEQVADRD